MGTDKTDLWRLIVALILYVVLILLPFVLVIYLACKSIAGISTGTRLALAFTLLIFVLVFYYLAA